MSMIIVECGCEFENPTKAYLKSNIFRQSSSRLIYHLFRRCGPEDGSPLW